MKPAILMENITIAARKVDAYLSDLITSEEQIENLHEGVLYALGLDSDDISFRGKRLRPALGMIVCEALGGKQEDVLPFASAIEIFHNFTLVHDDIEDGDNQRRNRPCVYKKFGMPHGINIGDFMLVKVFRPLVNTAFKDYDPEITQQLLLLLLETLEHTHIGQALDMNALASDYISREDYFRLVTEKTGYCLAAPMNAAVIVTKSKKNICDSLMKYAAAIGPLFQIRDDVIDLTEGKGREIRGSDIKEGKRSFLAAHVSEKCSSSERKDLYSILNAPRDETSDEDVKYVRSLFEKYGTFEAAASENERLMNLALQAVENTPEKVRNVLVSFAKMLEKRKK